jgi:hypothetical protein
VSLPGPLPAEGDLAHNASSWEFLTLTLRFHLSVGYALLVVRIFGPYHRLIPSADWLQSLPGFAKGQATSRVAELEDSL